jgi:hypothetical protein
MDQRRAAPLGGTSSRCARSARHPPPQRGEGGATLIHVAPLTTVATSPEAASPLPPRIRGAPSPSPAEGGGFGRAALPQGYA